MKNKCCLYRKWEAVYNYFSSFLGIMSLDNDNANPKGALEKLVKDIMDLHNPDNSTNTKKRKISAKCLSM